MPSLAMFMIMEISILLIGFLIIVVYQLLTGKINSSGLLYDNTATCSYSPARVQLLVTTVTTACYYLLKVSRNPSVLPPVPPEWLLVVGGGNIIYLIGKTTSLLKQLLNEQKTTIARR